MTIRVTELNGRLVELKKNVAGNTVQKFGANWKPGVYVAEIINEKIKRTIRLIKTR